MRDEFAAFYAGCKDGCLRATLATVGDRVLAEDLVAEAFARAWARWSTLRRHPAPQAWVVRTALNLSVSWWRGRRREVPLESVDHGRPDLRTDGEQLGDRELLALLAALPRRQREVLALRVFLDLDTRQTAQALGIAEGTVTAHLFRATQALRARLDPEIRSIP